MKKRSSLINILILAIFITLISIVLVSAIETTLKQEYQPGETLIAEISGNFIDNIKAEDILFYSGRVFIPMVYDIAKIQDTFYLYALLPNKARDYTLIIKNAHFIEAGEEKKEDLKFNFSVSDNITLFSVNPGFIITNEDFNVKVESKLKTINIKAEFLNSTQETEVKAGREKTLAFSISPAKEFTLAKLTISSEETTYEIPVAIFPPETNISKEITRELRFSKSELNFTVLKNQKFGFEILLLNTGKEDIQDITLTTDSEFMTIEPEKIENLTSGNSVEINLTVNSEKEGNKQGSLSATSKQANAELLLFILTLEDKKELENLTSAAELTEEKTCSELGGKPCVDDQICEGISKLTRDGLCCVGECKKQEAGTGKTIYLLVIIIVLLIIAIFVYKKLKVRKSSSKEILRSKEKEYEERFKSTEVKGGLTKV